MHEQVIKLEGFDEITQLLYELKELILFHQLNNLPKYLAVETIEKKFLVTGQTLNKLAKEGKLKKYKLSDRKIYFATQDIYTLIEQNQVRVFKPNPLKK